MAGLTRGQQASVSVNTTINKSKSKDVTTSTKLDYKGKYHPRTTYLQRSHMKTESDKITNCNSKVFEENCQPHKLVGQRSEQRNKIFLKKTLGRHD